MQSNGADRILRMIDQLVIGNAVPDNLVLDDKFHVVTADAGYFFNRYFQHDAVFFLNIAKKIGVGNDDLNNIPGLFHRIDLKRKQPGLKRNVGYLIFVF